jgi:hypothetical protein
MPSAVLLEFTSLVTPNPDAIFSQLTFARDFDKTSYAPVDPATVFENPVKRMVAIFSFDQMTPNAQWTALWYRDGQLVHYETLPWDGSTGGYGFAEWAPPASEWQPGEYEVQIFVGLDWKVVGRFIVEGDAPAPAASPTPINPPTETLTATPIPVFSPTLTATLPPTWTITPSNTPAPSLTPRPSATPRPVDTLWPTATP